MRFAFVLEVSNGLAWCIQPYITMLTIHVPGYRKLILALQSRSITNSSQHGYFDW